MGILQPAIDCLSKENCLIHALLPWNTLLLIIIHQRFPLNPPQSNTHTSKHTQTPVEAFSFPINPFIMHHRDTPVLGFLSPSPFLSLLCCNPFSLVFKKRSDIDMFCKKNLLFFSFLICLFLPLVISCAYSTGCLHAADQCSRHLPRWPGLPDTSTQRVFKMWPQEDPTCESSSPPSQHAVQLFHIHGGVTVFLAWMHAG